MTVLYDDRRNERYEAVQSDIRKKLDGFAAVLAVVLILAFVAILTNPPDLRTLRGATLVSLVIILVTLEGTVLIIRRKPTFYTLDERQLTYPRLGGLARGVHPVHSLGCFYRQGRDESVASIAILQGRRRVLTIPEDYLTSPSDFVQSLRTIGVKELASRFLRRRDLQK